MQLCHLLSVEPVGLSEQRFALDVQVLPEHLDLGSIGIRFPSHPKLRRAQWLQIDEPLAVQQLPLVRCWVRDAHRPV